MTAPRTPPATGDAPDACGPELDFAAMEAAFRAAVGAVGSAVQRRFRIADQTLRLVIAGPALAPVLLPALAHLERADPALAGLEVLAFDSASTGVAPPSTPLAGDESAGRVVRVLQRGAGLFSMLHRDRCVAVVWTEDAAAVPANEVAAPLRMVLHLWLAEHDWQVTHAAAVGSAAGGVIIGGPSGAGKSTTALAAVEAGVAFAGDDYVLVRAGSPCEVCSLFASAKLQDDQLARFPGFAEAVANPGRTPDEKPVMLLHQRLGGRFVSRMEVRAVVIPRVTGRRPPALRPLGPVAALSALAPSTIFQLPFDRAGTLRRLRRLVEAVPCYSLEVGPDLAAVGAAVRDLVEGA